MNDHNRHPSIPDRATTSSAVDLWSSTLVAAEKSIPTLDVDPILSAVGDVAATVRSLRLDVTRIDPDAGQLRRLEAAESAVEMLVYRTEPLRRLRHLAFYEFDVLTTLERLTGPPRAELTTDVLRDALLFSDEQQSRRAVEALTSYGLVSAGAMRSSLSWCLTPLGGRVLDECRAQVSRKVEALVKIVTEQIDTRPPAEPDPRPHDGFVWLSMLGVRFIQADWVPRIFGSNDEKRARYDMCYSLAHLVGKHRPLGDAQMFEAMRNQLLEAVRGEVSAAAEGSVGTASHTLNLADFAAKLDGWLAYLGAPGRSLDDAAWAGGSGGDGGETVKHVAEEVCEEDVAPLAA